MASLLENWTNRKFDLADPLRKIGQEDGWDRPLIEPPGRNASQAWPQDAQNLISDFRTLTQDLFAAMRGVGQGSAIRQGMYSNGVKPLSNARKFYALTGGRVDARAPLSPQDASQTGPWAGKPIAFRGSPSGWNVDVRNYVPGQGLKFQDAPQYQSMAVTPPRPGTERVGDVGDMATIQHGGTTNPGTLRQLYSPYGEGRSFTPAKPKLLTERRSRLLEDMPYA